MHILSTIRPTQHQLQVLAKLAASAEFPARAAAEISSGANLIAARNMLMKLGCITYTESKAELTDKGRQIAQEQNIIDINGQLTDEGNQLATGEAKPEAQEPSMAETPPDLNAPQGNDLEAVPPMEGFSPLFKQLILS